MRPLESKIHLTSPYENPVTQGNTNKNVEKKISLRYKTCRSFLAAPSFPACPESQRGGRWASAFKQGKTVGFQWQDAGSSAGMERGSHLQAHPTKGAVAKHHSPTGTARNHWNMGRLVLGVMGLRVFRSSLYGAPTEAGDR